MNQTLRRIPIDFAFGFLTDKTEYDYTKDWNRLGMRWVRKSCNKPYKHLEPISHRGLLGLDIDICADGDGFIFYDENGNRIKKGDDETDVEIQEFKDVFILKDMFQGNETYFINQFKLSQAIFDLETWLVNN